MRRLTPDEAALWRRVAGTVRPRKGRLAQPTTVQAEPVEALSFFCAGAKEKDSPSTSSGQTGSRVTKNANTLDGTWDKQIGSGRIHPDRTIDLHGHNLAGAHRRLEQGLEQAARDGARVILLVTGRSPRAGSSRVDLPLRGIIRVSVPDWLAASRHSGDIAAVRYAHPRHGGAGALYIVLRRKRG